MRVLTNIRKSAVRICCDIWYQCVPNCDVHVTWWKFEVEFTYSAPTHFRCVRKIA